MREFCAFKTNLKFQVIHLTYSFVYLIQVSDQTMNAPCQWPTSLKLQKISNSTYLLSLLVLRLFYAYLYDFKSYLITMFVSILFDLNGHGCFICITYMEACAEVFSLCFNVSKWLCLLQIHRPSCPLQSFEISKRVKKRWHMKKAWSACFWLIFNSLWSWNSICSRIYKIYFNLIL